MSCFCCDDPICNNLPPRSLELVLEGSAGSVLTWSPPELLDNHEQLEGYDVVIRQTDDRIIFTDTVGPDATSYTFENQYFLQDDQEYRVSVDAIYTSCAGSAELTAELRQCLDVSFVARHVNNTEYTESTFVAETVEVPINSQQGFNTGCDGEITLRLTIPCLEKVRGVLTENGTEIFALSHSDNLCSSDFVYRPSSQDAFLKWEILYDFDCSYGTPVFGGCDFGNHTIVPVVGGCITLPQTLPFILNC
jgi:hypothetical protein